MLSCLRPPSLDTGVAICSSESETESSVIECGLFEALNSRMVFRNGVGIGAGLGVEIASVSEPSSKQDIATDVGVISLEGFGTDFATIGESSNARGASDSSVSKTVIFKTSSISIRCALVACARSCSVELCGCTPELYSICVQSVRSILQ